MKETKALRRLTRVEELITDVIERLAPASSEIRELLGDARTTVSRAKGAIKLQQSSEREKKATKEGSQASVKINRKKTETKVAGGRASKKPKRP